MPERLQLLLDVTLRLAAATSEEEVARVITDKGVEALGAGYGGLWLLAPDRTFLRLVAVSSLPRGSADRWTRVPIDVDGPIPQCVRTSEPIFIESLDEYRARFPDSFQRIQETVSADDATYVSLPLVHDATTIGALALTYERPRAVAEADRTLLLIIARLCTFSLKRIELIEAERAARLEAEEATRAREEILGVVSHDLRNPLGTIMMGASTLQAIVEPSDAKGEKILTIADRIQRQADRMARLIDDVMDFAGMQAGKLKIVRAPVAPDAIISTTAELLGAVAQERGIGFSVDVPADLPPIAVDRDRAVQVLSSLLANALKVTTKGNRVAIGALGGNGEVVFFVRDSGPGIEATELPKLFERYWRSKKATYKGAGLGLSIARGIVEAHDGRIWAESQVGVGSTFFFTLTPRA